jgi:hypothetical protein
MVKRQFQDLCICLQSRLAQDLFNSVQIVQDIRITPRDLDYHVSTFGAHFDHHPLSKISKVRMRTLL